MVVVLWLLAVIVAFVAGWQAPRMGARIRLRRRKRRLKREYVRLQIKVANQLLPSLQRAADAVDRFAAGLPPEVRR